MPYVEVKLKNKLERVFDLSPRTVVGRAPDCDIQLLSRAVSRRHAAFAVGGTGVFIQDLGSPNGIKVNGKRVQGAHVLNEGDTVVVGDVPIVYHAASRTLATGESLDLRSGAYTEEQLVAHLQKPRAAFTVPAEPGFLSNLQSNLIRGRIERLGVHDETKLRLQIALAEAIENAVTHGSGGDPRKAMQLIFEETDEEFRMTVRDQGPGFDYEKVLANAEGIDAVEATRNRATLGPGLGLRMILDCVDRLQFDAAGKGCAIHMAKYKEDAGMMVIEDEEPPADEGA